ncbi:MAG: hypothetical protein IPH64_09680 [Comamonadaceae bacterium]|nr:hypothetical protein [Comamonadaceae bacterium]
MSRSNTSPTATSGDFNIGGKGEAIFFDQHLYSPLLHLRNGVDTDLFSVSPVHLNEGERDFVVDLRTFCQSRPALLGRQGGLPVAQPVRAGSVAWGSSFEAGRTPYPTFSRVLDKGYVMM